MSLNWLKGSFKEKSTINTEVTLNYFADIQ